MKSYVQTFDGNRVDIDKMSHQHVSNWIWYNKFIYKEIKNVNQ